MYKEGKREIVARSRGLASIALYVFLNSEFA